MAKYLVRGKVLVNMRETCFVWVEADDREQAARVAQEKPLSEWELDGIDHDKEVVELDEIDYVEHEDEVS